MFLDVRSFTDIMAAYNSIGIKFRHCIDGGAGAGHTASSMLPFMKKDGIVFAFEPFPGNFPFFDRVDSSQIKLIKKAMYNKSDSKKLFVSSTVEEGSSWAKHGMVGYSSLGFIEHSPEIRDPSKLYEVTCCAADEEISARDKIDFVKLDLQGGELNALRGMKRIIFEPYFLWIEFTGQNGLLELLYESEFIIFETVYLMYGDNPDMAGESFTFLYKADLSTGAPAYYARRNKPWGKDFHDEFNEAQKKYGLIQTDIICVHPANYKLFNKAITG